MAGGVVGRHAEIAALGDVLDRAASGPAGLHLDGEPGIGKTALLRAAAEAARGRGFTTLVASGGSDESELPYGVLADLLVDAPAVELPDVQRAALDAVAGAARGPVDERAVVAAVAASLRALAPVALVVDDLQWVDAESRTVLAQALRRAGDVPLAVVTAARPEGGAPPSLGVHGATAVVPLGGLDAGTTAELVERRVGTRVSPPTAEALHAATLGNPLLALEIARLMATGETGVLGEAAVPVPERLRRTLRQRLDALPATSRAVVEAVAVAGRADGDLLAALLPGEDVAGAVHAAREAGVLDVEDMRLRVFHPLARTVVLDTTDDARLRRLHARLAEVVADPFDRARHLVGATREPDAEVAAEVAAAAGEAARRGARSAAARLYEHAARLSVSPADASARRGRAGELWYAAGDAPRAVATLREAVAAAPPETLATVRTALGRVLGHVDGAAAGVGEMKAALDAAVTPVQRATAHRDLAAFVRFTEGHWRALDHARTALALAEEAGDDDLVLSCIATVSMLELNLGLPPAPGLLDRGVALERRLGTRSGYESPRLVRVFTDVWRVRLDEARAEAGALVAEVDPREPAGAIYPLYLLGLAEWRAGRWDAAAAAYDRLHATAEQCGWTDTGAFAWLRAMVLAVRGDHAGAREWADRARTAAAASGEPLWADNALAVDGFVALAEGDAEAAVEALRPATLPYDTGNTPGTRLPLPDLVEALCATGRAGEAEAALAAYEAAVLDRGEPRHQVPVARCRALVEAARGDLEGAVAALSAVAGVASPEAFQVARNDLVLGSLLRRARRRREAAAVLDRARAAFAALGAPAWEAKAAAETARLGRRSETPEGLTPTEAAVGRLVAAGRTNREVAAELSLSVKTVEWNLTRVYRKLGVASRAALAARADELLKSGDSPGPPGSARH